MTDKIYINDDQIKCYLIEILRQMTIEEFKPELVVGLVRGGCVPSNLVSQFYNIPCYMINKDVETLPRFYPASKILVIDDINDTGKALTEINNMLFEFNGEVKYATLLSNEASSFTVDYTARRINKLEDPRWIVFPWENWWIPELLPLD